MATEQVFNVRAEQPTNEFVVLQKDKVTFDSEGRAVIIDRKVVEFMKEIIARQGEVTVAVDVNVNCGKGCTINVFCKPK